MKETVEQMISASAIDTRVAEIASEIMRDYPSKNILLIGILKGSVIFLSDLARKLNLPVQIDFMKVESYHDKTESDGEVEIRLDLETSIEGRDVILVEDIIDSGRTLSKLVPLLIARNPQSFRICALLDKPDRRVAEVNADYVGFTIPDEFVVGYGLDFAQKYRNLEFIGTISFSK